MGVGYNPRIVTDGLVLCLDAANKRSYPGSGTTWIDKVGGNNGTLINGPTFSSDNGGSVVFDGTNDRIDCAGPSELNSISEITMITWINYDSVSYFPKIISRGHSIGGDLLMGSSDNSLYLYYSTSAFKGYSDYFSTTTGSINLTSGWVCVAATSGSVVKFYKNSDLVYTSGGVTTNLASSSSITIGNRPQSDRSFDGKIGVAMVYNRVLTAEEILQNYEATKGRYA
jgi:hypothetical protein